jgi:hypothetical protein
VYSSAGNPNSLVMNIPGKYDSPAVNIPGSHNSPVVNTREFIYRYELREYSTKFEILPLDMNQTTMD